MNLAGNRHPISKEASHASRKRVRKSFKNCQRACISRNFPVGDEEDSDLGDFAIEDKNALQPLDTAIQSNLSESTTKS